MEKLNILQIETERLLLVPITMQYAEDIFREFTPEITRYMTPKSAEDISETQQFIHNAIAKMEEWKVYQAAILDKYTQEFLWCVGLNMKDMVHPELGIRIKKSAHGKKIWREAVAGVEDRAQQNMDFEYLFYPVDKDNIGSRKIAESLWGVVQKNAQGQAIVIVKDTMDPTRKMNSVAYHIPKKVLLPTWVYMTKNITEEEYTTMIRIMEENDLSRYNITKEEFIVIRNQQHDIISFGRIFEIWPKQREVWSLWVDQDYRGQKFWLAIVQKLVSTKIWDNDIFLATKNELGQYYEKVWFTVITKNIPEKLIHTGIWAKSQGIDFIIMKVK